MSSRYTTFSVYNIFPAWPANPTRRDTPGDRAGNVEFSASRADTQPPLLNCGPDPARRHPHPVTGSGGDGGPIATTGVYEGYERGASILRVRVGGAARPMRIPATTVWDVRPVAS